MGRYFIGKVFKYFLFLYIYVYKYTGEITMTRVNFYDKSGKHYVENLFKEINVFGKSGKLLKVIKKR